MAGSDPFGGLSGANRDAYAAMYNMLKQWGLETLAPKVLDMVQQGYSSDTISVLLPETSEYKQRFSANDARAKAGLPVLNPAEYLSVEQSYRQIMSSAGLPKGFYDNPDDFTAWIAGDVSPTEVQARVKTATDLVTSADSATQDYFKQYYSHGDMVAYALDRSRAQPLIEAQARAATIGGAAAAQGINLAAVKAMDLSNAGVTQNQAQQGFGFIKSEMPNANKLAAIDHTDPLTTDDLMKETFGSDSSVTDKRKKLASNERARFGGGSAAGKTSLSRESAGQF